MNVFVVTGSNLHGGVAVHGVHWTHWHAERNAVNLLPTHGHCTIHEVHLDPLNWLVNSYYKFRGLTEPSADEALCFVNSEVGELNDAYVHTRKNWVRNNPEAKAGKRVDFEMGDVVMMLARFGAHFGYDPLTAMIEKFQSKGWRQ